MRFWSLTLSAGFLYTWEIKPPSLWYSLSYSDDTCIHMESLNLPGTYVEGVRTETGEDDSSKKWKDLYERVQRQSVRGLWEGR